MRVCLCTTPQDKAEEIARALVEERLAACVSISPRVRSIYRWKGVVESEDESLLIIKTQAALFEKLEARIAELHPYEVFELIALRLARSHEPYLEWLRAETGPVEGD